MSSGGSVLPSESCSSLFPFFFLKLDIFIFVFLCIRRGIVLPFSCTCKTYRVSNVVHCCRHAMPTSLHLLFLFLLSFLLYTKINLIVHHSTGKCLNRGFNLKEKILFLFFFAGTHLFCGWWGSFKHSSTERWFTINAQTSRLVSLK